jgi:SAM-dependent methyltransferase
MAQLEFDANLGRQLEAMYRTRDVLRRRRLVREALAPQPGERVLDVGTGPGFYAAELLDLVGPEGSVTGVDASAAMLAIAKDRCQAHPNATFAEGDASELPVEDGYFDAAISVQVLEYVEDISAALAEIRRALRPGGRVVLWDVDWTTLSMNAVDEDLSRRVLAGWDEHLAHPALPRTLAGQMRAAGFADVEMEGHAFATSALDPETYGGALVSVIEGYLVQQEILDADLTAAWRSEQLALEERGEFFCAVTQFRFSGHA